MNIHYNNNNYTITEQNYQKLCLVAEQQEFNTIDETIDYLLYVEGEL